MAVVAGIGTDNVIRCLALRRAAIMATEAGTGHQVMIKTGRRPGNGRMTLITLRRGNNMRGVFSGGR